MGILDNFATWYISSALGSAFLYVILPPLYAVVGASLLTGGLLFLMIDGLIQDRVDDLERRVETE